MQPLKFVDSILDEMHRSERVAGWWHFGLAVAGVIGAMWHLLGTHRHWRAARRLKS
jgi:hypothetical protein